MTYTVLFYEYGGLTMAHCVEMNIRYLGKNQKDALRGVKDLMQTQVNFAEYYKQPELLDHSIIQCLIDVVPDKKAAFRILQKIITQNQTRTAKL